MSVTELKMRLKKAEAEVIMATKRLHEAQRIVAEATAVAWVAYFADDDWMKREHVGFQVIPISQEVRAPEFIMSLLEEHFVLLVDHPELIVNEKFGMINRTSKEFSDKSQRGTGWYEVVYAVYRTKEEAVNADDQLQAVFRTERRQHAG